MSVRTCLLERRIKIRNKMAQVELGNRRTLIAESNESSARCNPNHPQYSADHAVLVAQQERRFPDIQTLINSQWQCQFAGLSGGAFSGSYMFQWNPILKSNPNPTMSLMVTGHDNEDGPLTGYGVYDPGKGSLIWEETYKQKPSLRVLVEAQIADHGACMVGQFVPNTAMAPGKISLTRVSHVLSPPVQDGGAVLALQEQNVFSPPPESPAGVPGLGTAATVGSTTTGGQISYTPEGPGGVPKLERSQSSIAALMGNANSRKQPTGIKGFVSSEKEEKKFEVMD